MNSVLKTTGLQRRRLMGTGLGAGLSLGLGTGALALLTGCGGGNSGDDNVAAVAPTLQIGSDAPGEATGTFTVRFTFSAAVTDFLTSRVFISNGFLAGAVLNKQSETLYTLAVTPQANRTGAVEVRVLAGGFKDSTGAAVNTQAYSFSQPFDTVVVNNEPVLTITHNASANGAAGPITIFFAFNLDVGTSFSSDSLVVSGGTLTSFTRISGTSFSAVVTPPTGTTGLVLLQVPAGVFTSTAGIASQQDYGLAVFFTTP